MKITFLTITALFIAFFMIPRNYDVSVSVRGEEVTLQEEQGVDSSPTSSSRMEVEKVASDESLFVKNETQNKIILADNKPESRYTPTTDIESFICQIFGDVCLEAIAVFKAESGLRADAQGWNCYYYRADGSKYSTACNVEDRHLAWSVDCGITQMNVVGQTCPSEYFDPHWNIEKAYEWKYLTRNKTFTAWVAYTSGSYKRFIIN